MIVCLGVKRKICLFLAGGVWRGSQVMPREPGVPTSTVGLGLGSRAWVPGLLRKYLGEWSATWKALPYPLYSVWPHDQHFNRSPLPFPSPLWLWHVRMIKSRVSLSTLPGSVLVSRCQRLNLSGLPWLNCQSELVLTRTGAGVQCKGSQQHWTSEFRNRNYWIEKSFRSFSVLSVSPVLLFRLQSIVEIVLLPWSNLNSVILIYCSAVLGIEPGAS